MELKNLPLTTSAEFREVNTEALLSCPIDNKNFLLQTTSGSTGSPLRIYVHNRENRARQLMVIRSLREHGWKPWWRGVYLWRPIETAGRSLFQSVINNRRKFIWIYLPFEEQVKQIKALKPDLLFGLIGPLKALAQFITDKNIEPPQIRLIVTGGQTLYENDRQLIQTIFKGKCIDGTVHIRFQKNHGVKTVPDCSKKRRKPSLPLYYSGRI